MNFITEDLIGEVEYASGTDHVYALENAQILDGKIDRNCSSSINNCHVKMAVNSYGKGRSFYLAGLKYNAENTRLLYRAMLWCAGKEALLKRAFSSNIHTECHYYPAVGKYALVNNSGQKQETTFYDRNGKQTGYVLQPDAIVWIEE